MFSTYIIPFEEANSFVIVSQERSFFPGMDTRRTLVRRDRACIAVDANRYI